MSMFLDFDFFTIRNDKIASAGRVLISEPFLSDTYFKRSVVFLTEHSEEGSVGFVLNKSIDMKIDDVIQDFPFIEASISVGGPVNTNTIHYIHTLGDLVPESRRVMDELYWGGDFEVIRGLISAGKVKKNEIRFFLGYSGWSPGQLEEELENNAWLVADIRPDMVMKSDQANFWNEILQKMNNKYQVWANFPENPGLN